MTEKNPRHHVLSLSGFVSAFSRVLSPVPENSILASGSIRRFLEALRMEAADKIDQVCGKSGRGDASQRGASYGKDPRTALHNREVTRG
jgi:hypothetical protein